MERQSLEFRDREDRPLSDKQLNLLIQEQELLIKRQKEQEVTQRKLKEHEERQRDRRSLSPEERSVKETKKKQKNYSTILFALSRIQRKKNVHAFNSIKRFAGRVKAIQTKVMFEGVSNYLPSSYQSEQRKKSGIELFLRSLLRKYNAKSLEGAFSEWKANTILIKQKQDAISVIDKFNQEVDHLKKTDEELRKEIEKLEKEIKFEKKEAARTQVWITTKLRKENEKFAKKAQRILMLNGLQMQKSQNQTPAFYRMLINTSLIRLKELYKQEMKANSKDFVYETAQERRKYKAVMQKDPRKIHKKPMPNVHLQKIGNCEMGQQLAAPKTIKYEQILRAVVTVQRKFRQQRMKKLLEQDDAGMYEVRYDLRDFGPGQTLYGQEKGNGWGAWFWSSNKKDYHKEFNQDQSMPALDSRNDPYQKLTQDYPKQKRAKADVSSYWSEDY